MHLHFMGPLSVVLCLFLADSHIKNLLPVFLYCFTFPVTPLWDLRNTDIAFDLGSTTLVLRMITKTVIHCFI